jgi:hypothetical protein
MEFDPVVLDGWQDENTRAALDAILEPHRGKKRTTAIRVAWALANEQNLNSVFGKRDTCARSIWYGETRRDGKVKQGWRDVAEIARAVQVIEQRALEWRDTQTARLEAHYRAQRLREIARGSAIAPKSLISVMQDTEQRGADRINAAMKLIALADPQGKAQEGVFTPVPSGSEQNTVNAGNVSVSRLNDDELDARIIELVSQRAGGTGDSTGGARTQETGQDTPGD